MLSRSIADIASALRDGEFSATELMRAALDRHARFGERLQAYKLFDAERALESARAADQLLANDGDAPPLTGIPISVKDLYGVDGLPTFAGTLRQLPEEWSRDAWLVAQLRGAGAITVGKTHMVEMAFGAVGINPHWDTPWNPWDDEMHRIPGGSSSGAGVSLWEGSALIALGSDTGGSIRIPAAFTGTVGQRTTRGRWPTEGVVPLSHTLDTVGALTRTVEDSIYFFGCVDPQWGDPRVLLKRLATTELANVRMAVPRCGIWDHCEPDIADGLDGVLSHLGSHAGKLVEIDGGLLDDAFELSTGRRPIASTECRAFLETELPGWLDILHPIVRSRVTQGLTIDDPEYLAALEDHRSLVSQAHKLFEDADVLDVARQHHLPPTSGRCHRPRSIRRSERGDPPAHVPDQRARAHRDQHPGRNRWKRYADRVAARGTGRTGRSAPRCSARGRAGVRYGLAESGPPAPPPRRLGLATARPFAARPSAFLLSARHGHRHRSRHWTSSRGAWAQSTRGGKR